ncbi:hypothetical protein [Legionella feeleii]|uniref:Uncharacterized protein n=1 Tax=Legionella feeleii TaxID=453 RepID=A0A0W0U2R7_9GAMM|nr:hypothetical protein [Legionella feeleii]KTD01974.1 hypothetical protein Lfee_0910 [Legionella feeleii]SPX62221.1 Uncharacterised protein [Legionella feeleii]
MIDNYIKQSINERLKSKNLNLRAPILTLIQNPTWSKKEQDELTKQLQIDTLSQEELNIIIGPWHRANKLAELWEQIDPSKLKKRINHHLKNIERMEREFNSNYCEINTLMQLLLGNEIFFHLDMCKEILNALLIVNKQNGQPYSIDYFIRYAINSLFYMGKEIGLKADGSPTSLHKYIERITTREQSTINDDYFTYNKIHEEINFFNNFSNVLTPITKFIFNPIDKNTQKILHSIKLRRRAIRLSLKK